MLMPIDILLKITEMGKEMKSDYILTIGNCIVGVDSSFIYMKTLIVDPIIGSYEPICYNNLEVQRFIKGHIPDSIDIDGYRIFNKETKNGIIINDMNIALRIFQMFSRVMQMKSDIVPLSLTNIREDANFEVTMQLKTDDGVAFFKVQNKYILPIFNNLLPVNKADKVDLNIYDINQHHFLANYIVHKKKLDINVYILCMHLK